MSQSAIPHDVPSLIEAAAKVAGSQVKLAALLDTTAPTLIQMKQGKRPCNWRVRGKLRVVLGEDPARAFIAAMAEDLALSENADELSAAEGFRTMLAALPQDSQKAENPASLSTSGVVWRKRKYSRLRCPSSRRAAHSIDRALGRVERAAVALPQLAIRNTAGCVLSH